VLTLGLLNIMLQISAKSPLCEVNGKVGRDAGREPREEKGFANARCSPII